MKKHNTARRSASLHVLVYTLLYTKAPYEVIHLVHMYCRKRLPWLLNVDACQWRQNATGLILFKHKEWSVIELVLSELTVTEIGGVRRPMQRSRVDHDKDCGTGETHEAPVELLRIC